MDQLKESATVIETGPELSDGHRPVPKERDLNVKRVPMEVWKHAKVNSILSGLPFRDYVIAVLKGSKPLSPRPLGGSELSSTSEGTRRA